MPSPDFSQYIDLTPLNVDPASVYTGAIELARLTLPEFTLRQGTPEDAIFQAASYMTGITVGAINALPSRLLVGIASILGYSRYIGTRATVDATVTLATSEAAIIPQGTIFGWSYEDEDGEIFQYAFELTENLDISVVPSPPALPSGTANLRSITPGFLPTMPVGTELVVITTNTSILSAVSTDSFINGEDPETESDYLNSVTTHLRSLSSNLSTASQVQSAVLTAFREVGRCKVYDLTDPTGALLPADPAEPGYATVFVYGRGRQMTVAERSEIQSYLENRISASILQDVLEFTICGVGVRIGASYDSAYSNSEVEDLIEAEIKRYLSPTAFPLHETQIRSTNVLARIARLPGILYISSVALQPIGEGYTQKQWADVRVATTASITISSGLNAGDTLDGITLASGDRVLVKNQSTASQNGIYIVGVSPARATDADSTADFAENKLIYVTSGTTNGSTYWKQTTSAAITVDTTSIAFGTATSYQSLDFIYKGSLPDVALGSVTSTLTPETI